MRRAKSGDDHPVWWRLPDARMDAVAAMLATVAIVEVWVASRPPESRAIGTSAGLVVAGAVAMLSRAPLVGLLVGVGAFAVQDLFGGGLGVVEAAAIPATMVIFYTAAARVDRRWPRVVARAAAFAIVAEVLAARSSPYSGALALVIVGSSWAAGGGVRSRGRLEQLNRERAEQLDRERDHAAELVALSERARLARELHDVVAHNVSVMVIQSAAARRQAATDSARAQHAVRAVERAGREVLDEIRVLTGHGVADAAGHCAEHSLADLASLAHAARMAGLAVEVHVDSDVADMPPTLDLCAYRIIQEAVTNTIRHAGATRLDIVVRGTPEGVEIEVSDDGRGLVTQEAGAGHGLLGMRERISVHSGRIHIGNGESGGCRVLAWLPLPRTAQS